MSIKLKILEYLKLGHSLTALEALSLFGTMNLRNRISELRKEGYNIQDRTIHNKTTGKHYSQYWFASEPPDTEQEEAIRRSNLQEETQINFAAVKNA